MGIPKLQNNGYLPPGEHCASIEDLEDRFGILSKRRAKLMIGLQQAIVNLKNAGVRKIWIDGSFVTDKEEPSDIDGCWEYTDAVDLDILDPVFISDKGTGEMKKKYGLDFFISNWVELGSGLPFPRFFQVDRDGMAKGIVVLVLGRQNDYK